MRMYMETCVGIFQVQDLKKKMSAWHVWTPEEVAAYKAKNPDNALGAGTPAQKRNALQHLHSAKTFGQFLAPKLECPLENVLVSGMYYPMRHGM